MNPHQALRDALVTTPEVAAITTTIKPWSLWRASELPAITYHKVSRTGFYHFGGTFTWKQRRIQLKCWSSDYDEAQALAAAVETLDGYGPAQHGDTYIHRLRVDEETDNHDDLPQGREQPPYCVDVDIIMAYEPMTQGA